jgi:hypothetical protein
MIAVITIEEFASKDEVIRAVVKENDILSHCAVAERNFDRCLAS